MKLIKFLLILLLPFAVFSQIGGEDEVYLKGDRVEAKFGGGGIDNFKAFVNRNFDYSKVTKAGKLEGAFTIDEHGNVTKIRITQVLDVESATEFIRVLKMCPKWEPAKRGGKPISIEIKYPMVFSPKPKVETNANEPFKKAPKIVDSTVKNDDKEKNDPLNLYPAENKETNTGKEDNNIYNTAGIEKKPDYPGGLNEFYKYIAKNYKTPDVKGVGGKVFVTFIVEKDGSITHVKILRDIGYGTGEEAVRVLQNCKNWIPGEQQGKKVRVLYSLPISIQPFK
ncbi:energy transducer TonB [Flavobacterium sp.]|uniref:energy transducer TonB n=1 Tax=Flavobacterium sp. TaxID=239 RepID=UPI0025FB475A|nr:energy transducer TonB [Flavobacterium sp.]